MDSNQMRHFLGLKITKTTFRIFLKKSMTNRKNAFFKEKDQDFSRFLFQNLLVTGKMRFLKKKTRNKLPRGIFSFCRRMDSKKKTKAEFLKKTSFRVFKDHVRGLFSLNNKNLIKKI